MAIGKFNEGSEGESQKEITEASPKEKMENSDSKQSYDDALSEKFAEKDTDKKTSETIEGGEKLSLMDKIKSAFSSKHEGSQPSDNKEEQGNKEVQTEKSKSNDFRESLKVANGDELTKKGIENYNSKSDAPPSSAEEDDDKDQKTPWDRTPTRSRWDEER
ncbi:MAG: hypothetical protein R3Y63_12600 [Eubacteriales bacterium]